MKRIILLMLAIASMTAGNSQTNNDAKKLVSNSWFWFKEYKHHFINMKDSTDFVVVSMEGYTKKDLFQKMMLGLNDVYNDINKVVSTVGEDAITVNAYHEIKKSPFKLVVNSTTLLVSNAVSPLSSKTEDCVSRHRKSPPSTTTIS